MLKYKESTMNRIKFKNITIENEPFLYKILKMQKNGTRISGLKMPFF